MRPQYAGGALAPAPASVPGSPLVGPYPVSPLAPSPPPQHLGAGAYGGAAGYNGAGYTASSMPGGCGGALLLLTSSTLPACVTCPHASSRRVAGRAGCPTMLLLPPPMPTCLPAAARGRPSACTRSSSRAGASTAAPNPSPTRPSLSLTHNLTPTQPRALSPPAVAHLPSAPRCRTRALAPACHRPAAAAAAAQLAPPIESRLQAASGSGATTHPRLPAAMVPGCGSPPRRRRRPTALPPRLLPTVTPHRRRPTALRRRPTTLTPTPTTTPGGLPPLAHRRGTTMRHCSRVRRGGTGGECGGARRAGGPLTGRQGLRGDSFLPAIQVCFTAVCRLAGGFREAWDVVARRV